jgi:hypothetical protein
MHWFKLFFILTLLGSCRQTDPGSVPQSWGLSVLPASIRLDPSTNEIIDDRFVGAGTKQIRPQNLMQQNWIYDGRQVNLYAAKGEYISFQVVVTRQSNDPLKYIRFEIDAFSNQDQQLAIEPEVFLEWSVEVKYPSTGYPKASLGKGWYPDALIPYECIQPDSSRVSWRWVYPLELPDFNNRIDNQQSTIFWIDQYIPEDLPAGPYHSSVEVNIGSESRNIPVTIHVWDFRLPNQNKFKASLQHEGFLSGKSPENELEIYHLFKRNRISLMDPTYRPLLTSRSGEIELDWESFDQRLAKYFDGSAFTSEYGYDYGPGYGEPIETFILPFNVRGKHGNKGWPDIGDVDSERTVKNRSLYQETITAVRDHLLNLVNPEKTELTVYLNGLDESYFPEAWERMVYYGDMFKQFYPEVRFRIDGGYSEEAMSVVKNAISSWASHTINYDIEKVRKYQDMGIEDWLYGPMLYESKVNSWVGSSTFIDLPLVNDRAISWSCWKYGTYSWISWGIGPSWERAWYDPETWKDTYKGGADSDPNYFFKKLNGNALLAYGPGIIPNVDQVCPSIRLKTMRDGVQEFEYLRLLAEMDGTTHRADSIVNTIIKRPFGANSIGNLDVWSYDAERWDKTRVALGDLIDTHMKNR